MYPRRLTYLWAVVIAALAFCLLPLGSVAVAQEGFLDFSGARIGPGYSFRTGEAVTVAQLPFNLVSWQSDTLTAQLSADVLGVVPKLFDLSEARIGVGIGLHLSNPDNKDLSGGLGYEFERFGLCAYLNWRF